MAELRREFGVGTECGKCVDFAKGVLAGQLDTKNNAEIPKSVVYISLRTE